MAIKVKLEKDGRIVNGFVGFSWTLLFFGFWVPAFRAREKDFGLFLLFFIIKVVLLILLITQTLDIQESIKLFGDYKASYSMLTLPLLLTIIQTIEIWLAYFYNKYYTASLLANGYYPLENDKFSESILKDYTYLPYTKEELEDENIMEKYKEISAFARKEERSKAYSVLGIWGIFFVIGLIIRFLGVK